jgi:FkbM family methyltransferase
LIRDGLDTLINPSLTLYKIGIETAYTKVVLIPVKVLKRFWGVNPRTVVHVGAHNAEELDDYKSAGWGSVIWIEAQPQKAADLVRRIPANHSLIEAAVWDISGIDLNLNIMTNTESTSLLNLGTHSSEHPTVHLSHKIPIKTKTLAELLSGKPAPELVALDIQGVELRALKGYGSKISEVKWIYCEVNKAQLYEDCCLISEIDEYLSHFGFMRSATRWTTHNWGDALYENRNLVGSRSIINRSSIVLLYASWGFRSSLTRIKGLFRKVFHLIGLPTT